jgi:prepilin-type processing-associated H-X9-DG protein
VRRVLGPDVLDTVTYVRLARVQCDDEALRAACRLPWLQELIVENASATDSAVEAIRKLKQLRRLVLNQNDLTARPFRHVGEMTELRELKLGKIPLRDADMTFISRLTKLEWLMLPSRGSLTDDWLVNLEGLMNLNSLYLFNEAITNEGLHRLRRLANLTVLSLHGTRVTSLEPLRPLRKIGYLCLAYTPVGDTALANYVSSLAVYPFGVGGTGPLDYQPRWSSQSQLLPFLEQRALFNALNFTSFPYNIQFPTHGPPFDKFANLSALKTSIAVFLCPSDSDEIGDEDDPQGTAHNNYRANAGTMPHNFGRDSPDGTGRNTGPFWFQSSVRPSNVTDGLSNTGFFSERCLGIPAYPDVLADYYYANSTTTCGTVSEASPRFTHPLEWSGARWSDGNSFYTRYQHIFPPQSPSCLLGGTTDWNSPVLVTATSRHPGGVNLLLGDGSVRFVKQTVAQKVWQALGTIAGGELVGQDAY